mmetsp:Transcript_77465/g.222726  ORF Transcript_77465/g.222726 Transcript_77465/m.222726 type:complete len:201 (-) Transcript_77465:1368-1970(-)
MVLWYQPASGCATCAVRSVILIARTRPRSSTPWGCSSAPTTLTGWTSMVTTTSRTRGWPRRTTISRATACVTTCMTAWALCPATSRCHASSRSRCSPSTRVWCGRTGSTPLTWRTSSPTTTATSGNGATYRFSRTIGLANRTKRRASCQPAPSSPRSTSPVTTTRCTPTRMASSVPRGTTSTCRAWRASSALDRLLARSL